jgi:hypothetical protein
MLAEPTLSQLEVAWRVQSRPGYLAIVHVAWTVCMASRGMWAAMRGRPDEVAAAGDLQPRGARSGADGPARGGHRGGGQSR